MNNEFKDYYNILGVTPDASLSSIRNARERELDYNWNNSIRRSQIEEAYSVLSNVETRRIYDYEFNVRVNERERALRNTTNYMEYAQANEKYPKFTFGVKDEEQAVEEDTIKEQAVEEETTKEQLVEEETTKEQPIEEDATKEQPVEEEATKEQPIEEEATKEQPIEEEATKEQPIEEETTKEQPIEEETTKEQPIEEDAIKEQPVEVFPIKHNNATTKELSKLKKVAIYAGAAIFVGPLGIVVAHYALKKSKKYNLDNKGSLKEKKISNSKTGEAKLLEEYRQNLDAQIYELLATPHNNYNLEIARLRYENQIELIKKRLKFKSEQQPQRGRLLQYKLECMSLKEQLERAESRLETINLKIDEYATGKVKNKILNSANLNLYEQAEKIRENKNSVLVKKLEIKKAKAWKMRDMVAKPLKITRQMVGIVQDGAIKAFDVTKSFVQNVFKPYDDISFDYGIEEENKENIRSL